MYIFKLYHDDDSFSNCYLNGQPYDTAKRERKFCCFVCNEKIYVEKTEIFLDMFGVERATRCGGREASIVECNQSLAGTTKQ